MGGAEFTVGDVDGLYEILIRIRGSPQCDRPDDEWSEFGSNIHRAFWAGFRRNHLAFTMPVTQPKDRQFPQATAKAGHIFDVP